MVRRMPLMAVAAIALAACASSPEERDARVATSESRIINGTASDESQDAVVLLIGMAVGADGKSVQAGGCSATFLAPNLVLTARHCVASVSEEGFACDGKGNVVAGDGSVGASLTPQSLYVFTGAARPKFGPGGVKSAARGMKIINPASNVLCSNDIALVLLDKNVEGAKIAPIRIDAKPEAGETFTAVGYGWTATDDEPDRMQRTNIPVTRVGPVLGSSKVQPIPPNDFEVAESICQGDSGGPALATESGAVIGVVSRGGNGSGGQGAAACIGSRTMNIYTSTAPFKDLILKAYAEAGAEPWIEGEPNPRLAKLGTACTEAAECQGNSCVNVPSSGLVCAQACSDTSPCPKSFTCAAKGAEKLCVKGAPGTNPFGSGAKPGETTTSSCAAAPGSTGTGGAFALALVAGAGLVARRRRAR